MKPEEFNFWQLMAEAIGIQYPNPYLFMLDRLDAEDCEGFIITSENGRLIVTDKSNDNVMTDDFYMPIDYPLEYQDPPGTFEGLPIDLVEP